ncbi:hypothetical protein Anas_11488 [Armadillidium nasatum]|uniref:Transmembrane protein n=1 Tax=Armadillidium nasatum TaxID=96803 RepID=A0A5N5TC86_9CRUS|nr:hypothetical protein Anas_11488 [Armadillidium nasatum]
MKKFTDLCTTFNDLMHMNDEVQMKNCEDLQVSMEITQTILTGLITLNGLVIGFTFFVVPFIVFNKEVIILSLTTLLLILTVKYLKRYNHNVIRKQSQNFTTLHFNNRDEEARDMYGHVSNCSSEQRINDLSLQNNISLYSLASNLNDLYTVDLDNTEISENYKANSYSMKNINKSDFPYCKTEENLVVFKVENIELSEENLALFNKENLLLSKSTINIDQTEIGISNELTNTNQADEVLFLKANNSILSETHLSTESKKNYKVAFADALEKCDLESDTKYLEIEKQEGSELQTLLHSVKKEYITKTFRKSQSCAGKINSSKLKQDKQCKGSDVVTFLDGNFGMDEESVENEARRSSKSLGNANIWNAPQISNDISTITIEGIRFQKETINRLKKSLRPMSRFQVVEKIKNIIS